MSVNQGVLNKNAILETIEFYENYKKNQKQEIKLLIDSTNLETITGEARELTRLYIRIFVKMAIIKSNFFMRSFINLYSSISPKGFIKTFKDKDTALKWLEK